MRRSPPAGADEVDEQREIVDARMALGEKLTLDPLETPDGLVEQASHLGDMAGDGEHLGAQPVADCDADLCRNRRLRARPQLPRAPRSADVSVRSWPRATPARADGRPRRRCAAGHVPGRVHPWAPRLLSAPDGHRDPRLRASGGADRAAPAGTTRRLAPARLSASIRGDRAPALRRASRAPGARAGRRQRHARAPGAATSFGARPGDSSRCCSSRSARTGSGRASLDRRGACEAGSGSGRSSSSSRSVAGAGSSDSRGASTATCLSRRTSASHWPIPSAIRRSTRTSRARRRHPTAGLHFTPELLSRLDYVAVTLHVGPRHVPAGLCRSPGGARAARRALSDRAGRVGADRARRARAGGGNDDGASARDRGADAVELAGRTDLFITPGFEFLRVDALLTNFHLPRSSLLALVMAFAGIEETREIYRAAIADRYRFYSFGDAMLVL